MHIQVNRKHILRYHIAALKYFSKQRFDFNTNRDLIFRCRHSPRNAIFQKSQDYQDLRKILFKYCCNFIRKRNQNVGKKHSFLNFFIHNKDLTKFGNRIDKEYFVFN